MSFTIRGRRVAFDNIAVGSATGKQQTAVGTSGVVSGPSEKYFAGGLPGLSTTAPTSTNATDNMLVSTGSYTSVYTNETMINTN